MAIANDRLTDGVSGRFAGGSGEHIYERYRRMTKRREIDERDIDRLLAALTDRQIAELYGMAELEVSQLRRARRPELPQRHENRKREQKPPKS